MHQFSFNTKLFVDPEGRKGKYSCDICNKTFQRAHNHKYHMETHSDKEFLCGFCGKQFKNSRGVAHHQVIHTEEKSYSCDICGKDFHFLTSYKTHMATHSGKEDKV